MTTELIVDITGLPETLSGTLVVLCDDKLAIAPAVAKMLGRPGRVAIERATAAERFKGRTGGMLTLLAPPIDGVERLVVAGTGAQADIGKLDFVTLGGQIAGAIGKTKHATVYGQLPGGAAVSAEQAGDIALGARLRSYAFDRYKTKKPDEDTNVSSRLSVALAEPSPARKIVKQRDAVAAGVTMARDLVNEPPNVLFPEEFAKRAAALAEVGCEIEVLGDRELRRLKMGALLGVGQGSSRESRVVVMRWNGARSVRARPVAFIGKGVCFDTGGISIKPSGGMEDMKGDMAGAACVVGLMHALAARKAKVNAIGVIGLVENMPDGNAQRPGDIVTTMSGQTIEIINTDAEGRLVLADILWHTKESMKPQLMINLATLTGAIVVALGQEHAGMFSNNDDLSTQLTAAGKATGEKVWRMPLGPEYDKKIDSKFADMKNSSGRDGGAITAAQLLQRFVGDTPWAHLDIAGVAMGSPQTDINKSWSSGWGVRLLDRFVRDNHEG